MPKNTFPTTIEIVRDLFSHMDTKNQLSEIPSKKPEMNSKHLDASANDLFTSHYDVDLFLNQLCPKEFSERTDLQFVTLLKRNVLDRYNAMLLHARLTAIMDVNAIRKSVWSNYLVPALHKLIQFCISQMGFVQHWTGNNFIKESLAYLKDTDQNFANFLESDVLSPDDKNYISKFGRPDALPTPSTLKRLFLTNTEASQAHYELLCFARLLQALKIKYGFSLQHGNFIQFLAEQHNQKLKSHRISQHDTQALTFRAMAIANAQTHFPFLMEIPLSYQKLTQVFFDKTHVKRIDQTNTRLASMVCSTDETTFQLNILMVNQINKYLTEHQEVGHLLPYIHWAKAINLVYQYQFKEALTEYELCLDGLLYRDMRYLEVLLNEMLCITSLVESQNKLIGKISNLAIQFELKVGIFDPIARPDRFKTDFVFEEWEKEATLVGFFKYFTAETFSDKGTEIKKLIPKIGNLAVPIDISPNFKKVNASIYIDIEQRRKWPQLHYFVAIGDFSTARKLIEADANINTLTSNKESIVLLALNHITARSDETYAFIQYVFECGFDKELLNERTAKKQTCPLNLAVEENLPKLVKLLLENGANPNITGLYGISMLYQNLGVIGILNGHKVEQPNDKYLADSIRRHSNGGSDIESYKQLQNLPNHDPRKVLFEEVKKISLGDKKVCDAYEIFELLLQYGADPNQNTAQYPIKGYTPFMLAVEKDNVYAVDLMLKHGAQLEQSYVKADEGRRIFLNDIADFFNANQAKGLIYQH
ncbi:ankyrin repeat domain-containing protein [Acinetobacter pittii]|uniref:ankyrin repeat domain-containing protein n=2 Tax=Acinetobacter pittii TaxID=48296 RepID=UPI0005EB6525|nr:ankyrin repeat domain-containing protein [Acinetobacter pittii]RZG93028.1 ankyrin repeat domain-containing protein [Acinetobacter pittii]RZH38820.1 ankyrin repeat domain-containing protein [Acinetobacter pittii]